MENVSRTKYEKAVAKKYKKYKFIEKEGGKGIFQVKRNIVSTFIALLLAFSGGYAFFTIFLGDSASKDIGEILATSVLLGFFFSASFTVFSHFKWINLRTKDLEKLLKKYESDE